MNEQDERYLVTEDGFKIDLETGEIVGVSRPGIYHDMPVNSLEAVEAILEARQEIQCRIDALAMRQAAIVENLQAMRKEQERRLAYLTNWFGPQIAHYAAPLKDAKKQSAQTPFGKFGWRSTRGSISVREEAKDAAIEWASTYAPDAVKVEKRILVSAFKSPELLPGELFCVTAPEKRFFLE